MNRDHVYFCRNHTVLSVQNKTKAAAWEEWEDRGTINALNQLPII